MQRFQEEIMKKVLCVIILLFFSISIYAKEDLQKKEKSNSLSRTLSIGFGVNMAPDLAGLGETIMEGGVLDLNEDTLAANTNTSMLIVSDKDNAIYWNAAQGTSQDMLKFLDSYTEGGPMIGVCLSTTVTLDLNEVLGLPLFIRGGVDYVKQFSGGQQSRTLGVGVDNFTATMATKNEYWPHHGENFYEGGKLETAFTSGWIEFPITIGFMTSVGKNLKVFGGLGAGYIRGFWALNLKADDRYVQYMTAYSTTTEEGDPVPEVEAVCSGDLEEDVRFELNGLSFNFTIGFEFFFTESIACSFEFMGGGTAATVFAAEDFSPEAAKALTAAMAGETVATLDPEYLKAFAYPVSLGVSAFRLGVKYYIF